MTTIQTKYEATIWEKAEHWTFETTIKATSENQARAILAKMYPPRSYTLRDVRRA